MLSKPTTQAWPTFSSERPTGANQAAYVLLNAPDNVVVDPTFDTADDGDPWITLEDWTIASGKATHAGSNVAYLQQSNILVASDYYLVVWELKDYSAGSVGVELGRPDPVFQSADGIFASVIQCSSSP
ncbi:MAG: hypothetical protein ACYTFA_13305, partial [Planctomycetota bacterium]